MKDGNNLKTEDICDDLIQKVKEGFSRVSLLKYLQKDLGYSQKQSYNYLTEVSQKIAEIYKEMNINALQHAINDLDNDIEQAVKDKNRKLVLEIRKEKNALLGLHKQKLDVTSNGETIQLNINLT